MNRKYIISLLLFSIITGNLYCYDVFGKDSIKRNQDFAFDPESVHKITEALSKLAIETKPQEISDSVFMAAKAAVLDALGCAFAGHNGTGVPEIIRLTKHWGGREEATVWFDGIKVPSHEATFVNSVQLHAMDFDDYHPASDTHITAVLVPAVLSVGEQTKASGQEILTALILGAEVIGRLGSTYKARRVHSGFLPSSIIGGFGVTAATCRLKKYSVEETINAMGIWYAHASGNRQALFDRTLTKRIQPGIAARAGVFSSCLAGIGITGPTRIIGEQPASLNKIYGGDPTIEPPSLDEIMKNTDSWVIEELHYKNYASCGYSDMAIKSATELSKKHNLRVNNIKEIRLFGDNINSPFAGVEWEDTPTPQVLAQFCATYAAASAIKNRRYSPAEISLHRIVQDQDVDSLARRTRLCTWEEWGGQRPDEPFAIQVHLKDGEVLSTTSTGNERYVWPKDYNSLVGKFKDNISFSGLLEESNPNDLIYDIENLEKFKNIAVFIEKWLSL
jgi:2-methylcitrate dehydratase PrpD